MGAIIRTSFSFGVFLIFIGIILRIQHWPYGFLFANMGWCVYSVFIIIALVEYHKIAGHQQLTKNIVSGILGLLYTVYLIVIIASAFSSVDVFEILPGSIYYLLGMGLFFLFGGIVYMLAVRKKVIYVRRPKIEFDFDKEQNDM